MFAFPGIVRAHCPFLGDYSGKKDFSPGDFAFGFQGTLRGNRTFGLSFHTLIICQCFVIAFFLARPLKTTAGDMMTYILLCMCVMNGLSRCKPI